MVVDDLAVRLCAVLAECELRILSPSNLHLWWIAWDLFVCEMSVGDSIDRERCLA